MPSRKRPAKSKPRQIRLEDLFGKKNRFEAKSIQGLQSLRDGLHYTTLERGKRIVVHRYDTGKPVRTLLNAARFGKKLKKIQAYALSKDENRILVSTDHQKLYRHSHTATYYVFDLRTGKLLPVSKEPRQQLACLSPDGRKVALVSRNNLYLVDLARKSQTPLTRDGKAGSIINGAPDWVYEEEFGLTRAFDWSPDGRYLAYYRFDERGVRQFTIPMYRGGYPEQVSYKYPRAGEKNSTVSIHIYGVSTGRTVAVDIGKDQEQYVPRMKWTPDSHLVVARLNRLQNRGEYLLADPAKGRTRRLLVEKDRRYVELDHPVFLEKQEGLLHLSERDGWRHIYHYDMRGKLVRQVTRGRWDVTGLLGCDEQAGWVYYISAQPTPRHRTLYATRLDGTGARRLSTQVGLNSASFSKGFKYYINTFANATTPPLITLHEASGRRIRTLQTNARLKGVARRCNVPAKEFFAFTTSQGITLNGWTIKPPGFNGRRKYPVLMTVYGGPNSQTVMDSWAVGWEHLLAQRGYVVASVDGRGTGGRGEKFRKCTYRTLGKLEVIDQIEAARYLGSRAYVDASRIGIFGWSYGGFMACGCILRGAKVFKAAVAVAPVSSFRFYDTVYTERFMRTPRENPAGYDDWAPLSHAGKLEGKLLLVHGMADDNVHFQNSLELAARLIEADKHFQMHFVPNKDHGVNGHPTRLNLFARMTDFVLENL